MSVLPSRQGICDYSHNPTVSDEILTKTYSFINLSFLRSVLQYYYILFLLIILKLYLHL